MQPSVQIPRKRKSRRFKRRERGRARALAAHAQLLAADPSTPPLDMRAVDLQTFAAEYNKESWNRSNKRNKDREKYETRKERLFAGLDYFEQWEKLRSIEFRLIQNTYEQAPIIEERRTLRAEKGLSKTERAEKLANLQARLKAIKNKISADDRMFANIAHRRERTRQLNEERLRDNANERDPAQHRPPLRRISSAELAREYRWPGGKVGGRQQNAFVLPNPIISWQHPFLLRIVASTARCGRHGTVRAGMAKDRNYEHSRKISAFFNPYVAFSVRCLDMWRVDIDRSFANIEELRKFIAALDLLFPINLGAWIPDDENPGIHNPHLYFYLPDGHAVWDNKNHRRMLDRIIAAVTLALKPLGADPGGLANPFHGKNPVSPHCSYAILDEEMFTLSEFNQVLDLKDDRVLTARAMNNAALSEALDFSQSNQFLTSAGRAATMAAREVYRADPSIIHVYDKFIDAVIDNAMGRIDEMAGVDSKTRKVLEAQVRRSARWAVDTFEPEALTAAFHDPGAAKHLIKPGDDLTTRKQIGQLVGAKSRERTAFDKVSAAAVEILREAGGVWPELSDLRKLLIEKSGLGRTCVNKHLPAACVRASATLALTTPTEVSRQSKVQGAGPLFGLPIPPVALISTINRLSDLPISWQESVPDDVKRLIELRQARSRRRNTLEDRLPTVRAVGANLIDFLQAGRVVRHFGKRRLARCGVSQTKVA